MTAEPTVAVGRISRPHGVRGELAVVVLTDVASRFDPGATVHLEDGRPLTVTAARRHRGLLLVTFAGVADREVAKALAGKTLVVPASSSPPLPEGSWWDHDLVGCAVATDAGRDLGVLSDVIHTPANDVWSVVRAGEETLVPVLRDVLVSVDVGQRRIVVRDLPGLTAPDEG
ncbi:MAG: ribosome maturation factor RimM [Actinomycetota bacterium]